LLNASICSFSMKIVSVRSQLWLRTVRSSSSKLPTLLKSGCVLVASGVFFHAPSCSSDMRTEGGLGRRVVGNGLRFSSKGQVWPSPQKPYIAGVDVLDLRMAVVGVGQQSGQLVERGLERLGRRNAARSGACLTTRPARPSGPSL
jgi:hypothetical protein